MKNISSILQHSSRSKITDLAKLFSVTALSQLIIQIIGLVCGILIIRNFTVQEYSWYTISNTILGAMNILADGGIVMGVMAEGGKVWRDKTQLGRVIGTGLRLRKMFSVFSILVSGSVLVFLLTKNGAGLGYSVIVLLCLLPAFFANLTDAIYEIGPKLHQDLKPLQYNQIAANLGRLLLTFSTVFAFPFTTIALIATGLPRIIANIRLKKIASKYVDFDSNKMDDEIRVSILKTVKKILPLNIYNIFSVQISVWLLSLFGTAAAVAQTGALFRIGTVLTAFQVLAASVLVPRMARLQNSPNHLLRMMLLSQGFLTLASFCVVVMVFLLATPILVLFGKNYYGLEKELVLTMIIFCLNMFAALQYSLNAARSWVINPLLVILINISSMVFASFIFNIKELNGVLQFNIFVSATLLLLQISFSYFKILNSK